MSILLGLRSGRFMSNIWSGAGGKMEPCDQGDIVACAIRETREELGVRLSSASLRHAGTVDFYRPYIAWRGASALRRHRVGTLDCRVHIFLARDWTGEPTALDGFSRLEWFRAEQIPFGRMNADTVVWLPTVLDEDSMEHGFLRGRVYYASRERRDIANMAFRLEESCGTHS